MPVAVITRVAILVAGFIPTLHGVGVRAREGRVPSSCGGGIDNGYLDNCGCGHRTVHSSSMVRPTQVVNNGRRKNEPSRSVPEHIRRTADNSRGLVTLENARNRVAEKWTAEHYISDFGEVCALGAVMAADGLSYEMQFDVWMEQLASDAAKEAIYLLNRAALELYPKSASYGSWGNPIEYLNQELTYDERSRRILDQDDEDDPRRARVLECYDKAIADRITACESENAAFGT